MKRPCKCDKLDSCRLCWLYRNNPKYKKLWEESEAEGTALAQSTKADAKTEWNYQEQVAPPKIKPERYEVNSQYAIITVGVGEKGQQWLELSEPSMRTYAEKIGADFHKLTDSTMKYPQGEKWRVGQFLDCYERIIFLDADIIVRPTAPNLFELVPENMLGLHDDLGHLASYAWFFHETEYVQKTQGFPVRILPYCLNTGIIVAGQQHKNIFAPPENPFIALHCFEQHLINCRIFQNNYPVFKLPINTHWQHWIDKSRKIYDQGQFLHFSGELDHKARLQMMKEALPKTKKDCGCKKRKLADPTRVKALLNQAKKSGFTT